jgi:hypothetical protein
LKIENVHPFETAGTIYQATGRKSQNTPTYVITDIILVETAEQICAEVNAQKPILTHLLSALFQGLWSNIWKETGFKHSEKQQIEIVSSNNFDNRLSS